MTLSESPPWSGLQEHFNIRCSGSADRADGRFSRRIAVLALAVLYRTESQARYDDNDNDDVGLDEYYCPLICVFIK